MKTAMKKLFSLVLVAVLLVGVMPFQAFADEISYFDLAPGEYTVNDALAIANYDGTGTPSEYYVNVNGTEYGKGDQIVVEGETVRAALVVTAIASEDPCASGHNWADATCTAPKTCSVCGATEGNSLGHTWVDATYTAPKTCSVCGATEGSPLTPAKATVEILINNVSTGKSFSVDAGKNANEVFAAFRASSLFNGEHGPILTLEDSGTPISGTTESGKTYWLWLSKDETTDEPADEPEDDDSNSGSNIPSGNYTLKIMANLYVGEHLNKSIVLDEITGLSGDARVYQVISANKDRLISKFPAGYNNIQWTEAVYFNIDSDTVGTVDTKMKLSEENHVFINLYSTEKLVVVRVHTSKAYDVDRSVQVGGFRVGETVTYNDVRKAVKKYYNISDMTMYTYSEWEKVIAGKDAATLPYFEVRDGDNVYEVYVKGSRKASAGTSANPDSSNPKTGDMIFNAVTVMGASAACLATLFYLNKKRAY